MKRSVSDCYEAWERMEKREREIEEENGGARLKRTDEENWRNEKRKEEGGRRARDLNIKYHRKDLRCRFIADTGGIVDIHPLCLRHGCSKCEFLKIPDGKRTERSARTDD